MEYEHGGKHHGSYIKLRGQTDKQLFRSARSYHRNVVEHRLKIQHPYLYVEDWENRGDAYKNGIIKKWQKDIGRNQELYKIAISIIKERGLGDDLRFEFE